jgi:hypothetical protein
MILLNKIMCVVFNHHAWVLLEEYKPMVRAKILTETRFEEKEIPNPFKLEGIQGKWACSWCNQVSIGIRHNA